MNGTMIATAYLISLGVLFLFLVIATIAYIVSRAKSGSKSQEKSSKKRRYDDDEEDDDYEDEEDEEESIFEQANAEKTSTSVVKDDDYIAAELAEAMNIMNKTMNEVKAEETKPEEKTQPVQQAQPVQSVQPQQATVQPVMDSAFAAEPMQPVMDSAFAAEPVQPVIDSAFAAEPVQPSMDSAFAAEPVQPSMDSAFAAEPVQPVDSAFVSEPVQPSMDSAFAAEPVQPSIDSAFVVTPVQPMQQPPAQSSIGASSPVGDYLWFNKEDVAERPSYKPEEMYYHHFKRADEPIEELLMEMYDCALVRTEEIRYIAYGIKPRSMGTRDVSATKIPNYNGAVKEKEPTEQDLALIYEKWCSYVDKLMETVEIRADQVTINNIKQILCEFGKRDVDTLIQGM